MTKHTPGPWKVSKLDGRTINGKAYRNLEGNLVTPAIASIKERTGETEANAAYIVTACNCHDELVAACKEAIELIEIMTDYKGLNTWKMLKAALSKAEGGAR